MKDTLHANRTMLEKYVVVGGPLPPLVENRNDEDKALINWQLRPSLECDAICKIKGWIDKTLKFFYIHLLSPSYEKINVNKMN